jgi:glycosyltransferase involved in cell wall biosynthesis
MPKKGLEQVLELGRLIKLGGLPLAVRIIGRVPPRHVGYFSDLRAKAAGLPIVWDCDLSEQQIAQKLAESAIGYFPYPDGASERRGTLKAALAGGLAVITTRGPHTPHDLQEVVIFCQNPAEALNAVRSLIANPEKRSMMAKQAARYGEAYKWERIADLHAQVYRSVVSKRTTQGRIQAEYTDLQTRGFKSTVPPDHR